MSEAAGNAAPPTVADAPAVGAKLDAPLTRGDSVGRYVVLEWLGEGGMGVVYGAYDPELDRKVALKLLRPGLARQGSVGGTRLLREAQALARLSHPDVVAIRDVGRHGDEVWLAMEFVDGQTMGAWLELRPRTWREVLAVIRPVARGLSAAHEAGLAHRDVKPDNVMIGDDGRVRIMDFGLARSSTTDTVDPEPDPEQDPDQAPRGDMRPKRRALDEVVTRLGATPGTPAYMSPEQIMGRRADGRTDQFSLCVMLWEALYGELPFMGDSLEELATKIVEGDRRPAPRGISVPRWLVRVIQRGMAVHPEDRWPSLEAFVAALDAGQRRVRVSKSLAGIVVAALAGAGALYGGQLEERRRIAACEATGADIEDVWNDEVRERLREGLLATRVGYAETTADKVMPWLDHQANDWRDARTEACLNTEVRQVWDTDTLERSMWCLDDRRLELEALVAQLSNADAKGLTKAVPAAASLRQVQPCRDAALLSRLPAPPTEARDEVQAVWAELAKADALRATGAYEEGLGVAQESLGRAKAIGWSPLTAAARVREGTLLDRTGKYEEAASMLESAYFEATGVGATEVALSAAYGLVHMTGRLARHAEGERWLRHADVLRSKLHDPAGLREAESLFELAGVRWEVGAYEEAESLYERALGIYEQALGPEHPAVAQSLIHLAGVRWEMGAYEEAESLYEQALGIYEHVMGPEHPAVAQSLNNLAGVRCEMGAYEEAASLYEQALGIYEHVMGPEHPTVATSLNNLAVVRKKLGGYEEAASLYERALGIWEQALGPEHPDVAMSLNNLASVRKATGRYEEAASLYERALGIREKALGSEHPNVVATINNLASLRQATGRYEEAASLYERALGIQEQALGPEHPDVAYPLFGMAQVALAQDRPTVAVPLAERAVKLREANDVPSAALADARMLLARALLEAGADRTRAVTLATQAREAYRAAGETHREELAKTEAWLAKHGDER